MSAERIAEIRARLAAATPGPWEPSGPAHVFAEAGGCVAHVPHFGSQASADVALIAHAPADLEFLLAEVERLRAENDGLRAAVRDHRALLVQSAVPSCPHGEPSRLACVHCARQDATDTAGAA